MTTQPPSNDAVEAAMKKWELHKWSKPSRSAGILWNNNILMLKMRPGSAQRLIEQHNEAIDCLAAEVERLREQNKRQGIDLCAYVAEVAELRGKADAVCEWRAPSPTINVMDAECGITWYGRRGTYCPNCGRKVKIQPQTNDEQ